MKFSIIIASKSENDVKLQECLRSISEQDYPKDDVEVLVITEGTPESAKAIGLKRSTGEIICFMASDCKFTSKETIIKASIMFEYFKGLTGCYSYYYHYEPNDPILNRYFSLFGFNDPIPFYLGKCDRHPHYINQDRGLWDFANFPDKIPTLGDNGFFVRRDLIMKTDLEHYSHIDNCEDLRRKGSYSYGLLFEDIHHKTGDNLWLWIKKRMRYAESLNQNRRWRMLTNFLDYLKLCVFVILALTFVEPLIRSAYGYFKSGIRDKAWFLHPVICFITVFLYGGLWIKIQARNVGLLCAR